MAIQSASSGRPFQRVELEQEVAVLHRRGVLGLGHGARRPSDSAFTSFISFIASRMQSVCPLRPCRPPRRTGLRRAVAPGKNVPTIGDSIRMTSFCGAPSGRPGPRGQVRSGTGSGGTRPSPPSSVRRTVTRISPSSIHVARAGFLNDSDDLSPTRSASPVPGPPSPTRRPRERTEREQRLPSSPYRAGAEAPPRSRRAPRVLAELVELLQLLSPLDAFAQGDCARHGCVDLGGGVPCRPSSGSRSSSATKRQRGKDVEERLRASHLTDRRGERRPAALSGYASAPRAPPRACR